MEISTILDPNFASPYNRMKEFLMKGKLKFFWVLTFAVLILGGAYGNSGNLSLRINNRQIQYEVEAELSHYGNYYSNSAVNVDLAFFSDDLYMYFEFFVPNGNNTLVAGTYNISRSADNNHGPFSYSKGRFAFAIENDEIYYDVTGGSVTISTSGAGANLIYNISLNLTMEDDDGQAGTLTGDYRGTFELGHN